MILTRRALLPNGKSSSFTLVEILVVISIIGLLAGLAFPAIQGAIQAAKKAEVATMAQSIKTAIHAYQAEYMTYPPGTVTDADFISLMTRSNEVNFRGIVFLEIPPKFTNSSGLVTPKGFYRGTERKNFNFVVDSQGNGSVTAMGRSVPASVAVWVTDPANASKPVGTFK